MAKFKKGQKLSCVPCGREVVINSGGISRTTVWCCGKPMRDRAKSAKKSAKKK